MNVEKWNEGSRNASLYMAESENAPLVVLNNFSDDGSEIMSILSEMECPDINLLCINNLDWNREMAPWDCPPLFLKAEPFIGGADEYLDILLFEIIPKAKEMIKGTPKHVSIAGYSLAGLFAIYALYKCSEFDRAASMSGSLWFPKCMKYFRKNSLKKVPDKMYISLGKREAKTLNDLLLTVRDNTEELCEHLRSLGIDVTYELNPGNHFKDPMLRSAKGIIFLVRD